MTFEQLYSSEPLSDDMSRDGVPAGGRRRAALVVCPGPLHQDDSLIRRRQEQLNSLYHITYFHIIRLLSIKYKWKTGRRGVIFRAHEAIPVEVEAGTVELKSVCMAPIM